MLTDLVRAKVWERASSFYSDRDWAHGRSHIERVTRAAIEIGTQEGADLDIIELAAILHDIFEHRETHSNIEYELSLKQVGSRVYTQTGRRLAVERAAFMDEFFERVGKEIKGVL